MWRITTRTPFGTSPTTITLRFVPQITCRFQVSRLVTYFPTEWHEQHRISYVCANLIAIKEGPRQGGFLLV